MHEMSRVLFDASPKESASERPALVSPIVVRRLDSLLQLRPEVSPLRPFSRSPNSRRRGPTSTGGPATCRVTPTNLMVVDGCRAC